VVIGCGTNRCGMSVTVRRAGLWCWATLHRKPSVAGAVLRCGSISGDLTCAAIVQGVAVAFETLHV